MRLRSFLFRLGDGQLGDREWLESVAALAANKPPRNWNDVDAKAFGAAVAELCAQLRRVEEVALAKGIPAEEHVVRLGITDESGNEQSDLVRIRPEQQPALDRAMQAIEHTLRDLGLDAETELTALALLAQKALARRAVPGEERHEQ